jgi:hypothetical protein
MHTYIHTYIHIYIHAYIHTYMSTYMRTYIHTHTHTCTHSYIYAYTHIGTYARMHIPRAEGLVATCNNLHLYQGATPSQFQSVPYHFLQSVQEISEAVSWNMQPTLEERGPIRGKSRPLLGATWRPPHTNCTRSSLPWGETAVEWHWPLSTAIWCEL